MRIKIETIWISLFFYCFQLLLLSVVRKAWENYFVGCVCTPWIDLVIIFEWHIQFSIITQSCIMFNKPFLVPAIVQIYFFFLVEEGLLIKSISLGILSSNVELDKLNSKFFTQNVCLEILKLNTYTNVHAPGWFFSIALLVSYKWVLHKNAWFIL